MKGITNSVSSPKRVKEVITNPTADSFATIPEDSTWMLHIPQSTSYNEL